MNGDEEKRYVRYEQTQGGDWAQSSAGALLGVPNVDALNVSELQELESVLRTLHHVVRNKARAMHERLEGNVALAMRIEEVCEKYYAQLPQAYRW